MAAIQRLRDSLNPAASLQLRAIKFTVTVISASGLPHLSNVFGKERRFYVSATDGATTRATLGVQNSRQTVQWNTALGEFTLNDSSHLTLSVFAERKLSSDELVGTLKIQLGSIGTSPRTVYYDLVLNKDTDGHSSQRPIISLSITLSEAYLPTPIAATDVPEPDPVERQSGDVPTQISMPVSWGAESPIETPSASGALLGADEAMNSVQIASSSVVKAMSSLEKVPDFFSEAGDVFQTMGTVIQRIKTVMDTVDSIAELHPYAKMAWSVLSCIPKALLAQVERDGNVRELLSAIHDAFDLAHLVEPLKAIKPGSKQAQILTAMLQHVCDCGDFIKSYAQDNSFWTRFLSNLPQRVDTRVEDYRTTLGNLRDDFLRYATVTTEITVLNIEADVGRLSRRLEGISVQFEQLPSQIADLEMDGKIREIPYGAGSRFRRDKGCLEGTRIDFLDHIIDWVNTPGPTRCLVLMGHAGTGKSSIAHEIARRFDDVYRLTSSFVFLRAERSMRDSYLLFTTLARDLSDRYPSYKAALGRAIQNDTALRMGAKDYVTLFEFLLRQPLNNLHLFGPVFVVIDGLDECEDASGETGLHTFLADHISTLPPNFRILITSRPEKDIEQAFSGALSTNLLYMNDTKLSAKARDDICAYFQKNLPKRVVDQHGDALAEKAEGLFQWASVACGYIRRPPRGLTEGSCIRRLLNPSSEQKRMDPLDDLYRTILSSYFDLDDPEIRQRYQSVMGQLFALFEPLSIDT
ncbi:hypothetical protein BC834DRAFT_972973 [Gloeopeniophorella convolvens]|nr:hypothetical protein BC834DRAFT_972973 [Gloeopeniophorella convolvens]